MHLLCKESQFGTYEAHALLNIPIFLSFPLVLLTSGKEYQL